MERRDPRLDEATEAVRARLESMGHHDSPLDVRQVVGDVLGDRTDIVAAIAEDPDGDVTIELSIAADNADEEAPEVAGFDAIKGLVLFPKPNPITYTPKGVKAEGKGVITATKPTAHGSGAVPKPGTNQTKPLR